LLVGNLAAAIPAATTAGPLLRDITAQTSTEISDEDQVRWSRRA
jgi:hypothetical protein